MIGTLSSFDRRAYRLITPTPSCKTDSRKIIKVSLRDRFHPDAFLSACSRRDASGWADGFDAGPAEGRPENLVCRGFMASGIRTWRFGLG